MVLLLNTWIGNIMLERLQERRFAIFSNELEVYKWDAMASAKLYCSSIAIILNYSVFSSNRFPRFEAFITQIIVKILSSELVVIF